MRHRLVWLALVAMVSVHALPPVLAATFNAPAPSRIEIETAGGRLPLPAPLIESWVRQAHAAVLSYYGTFPLARVIVRVEATGGHGVGFATATEQDGVGLIEIPVGVRTTEAELGKDWTLTHEMMHLAFPLMPGRHRWLPEGISTYIEPIGRLRTRSLSEEDVWRDFVRDLARGLPRYGDRGLNNTHTRDRTYFGGALFCLMADIEIHRRTGGRHGLEDALRKVASEGGHIASGWSVERTLKVGDAATGTTVLEEMYAQFGNKPVWVDLPDVWRRLGVHIEDGEVTFNDAAPLAWIRHSISRGRHHK